MLLACRKVELEKRREKLDAMGTTNPYLVEWKAPAELLLTTPIPQSSSSQVSNQTARMMTVVAAQYITVDDIPDRPTPLSDVEETLQITSIATASVSKEFPFFAAQKKASEGLEIISAPTPVMSSVASTTNAYTSASSAPSFLSPATSATPDFVRSLGLPSFLVGHDVQALQTLAGSPGLMASFVDAQGRIDQVRLLQMINALTESSNKGKIPTQHVPVPPPVFNRPPVGISNIPGTYGQPPNQSMASYYQPTQRMTLPQSSGFTPGISMPVLKPRSYRGEQNGDGNLHLSGYGPTNELEIIQLFAPYLKVDEIVMKGTFSFVNSSDPNGAQTAMQALQGAFLGGRPIKISQATRRAPDPSRRLESRMGAFGGDSTFPSNIAAPKAPLPQTTTGEIDLDSVSHDNKI